MQINSEPLRIALSKIAPLEQWDVSQSKLRPKICWRLFRPNPKKLEALWPIINGFEGHTRWHLVDNCLAPGIGLVALPGTTPPFGAPSAGIQVSEADASSDLAELASEIEKRLDLLDNKPMSFSKHLLTREGFRKSHGTFEDFVDGGQRLVYLIVDPSRSEVFGPTKADIMLHFEPMDHETTAIFGDILGIDLTQRDGHTMTEAEADKLMQAFPLFWNVSDYYEGGYLNPEEAGRLCQECFTIDQIVSSPRALRGVDKLMRIANWASQKHYGIFFDPP